MKRFELVKILKEMSFLLDLKGENPFKVRAYEKAARTMAGFDKDLQLLTGSDNINKIKGIGESISSKIKTLIETGHLDFLDQLRLEFPESVLEMLNLDGVGTKKVKLFYRELDIKTIPDLERACSDGRISAQPGLGSKTADKLLASIKKMRVYQSMFLYPMARKAANEILAAFADDPEIIRIEVAGNIRRFNEITQDLVIVASTENPEKIGGKFITLPTIQKILSRSKEKISVILTAGLKTDLHMVSDDIFPCALNYFTGSKEHNEKMQLVAQRHGIKLSNNGLVWIKENNDEEIIDCSNERELYSKLNLPFIPPEIREDKGEIEHALKNEFPNFVQMKDYNGVLHCHSHDSDGLNTIGELVEVAKKFGHEFSRNY